MKIIKIKIMKKKAITKYNAKTKDENYAPYR